MLFILMDFLVYYVCIHVKNVVLRCFDMHGSEPELRILGVYFSPVQVADFASKNQRINGLNKNKTNQTKPLRITHLGQGPWDG